MAGAGRSAPSVPGSLAAVTAASHQRPRATESEFPVFRGDGAGIVGAFEGVATFLARPRAVPDRSEDFAAPVVCEGGGKATWPARHGGF